VYNYTSWSLFFIDALPFHPSHTLTHTSCQLCTTTTNSNNKYAVAQCIIVCTPYYNYQTYFVWLSVLFTCTPHTCTVVWVPHPIYISRTMCMYVSTDWHKYLYWYCVLYCMLCPCCFYDLLTWTSVAMVTIDFVITNLDNITSIDYTLR
jgi:hypothetical protein